MTSRERVLLAINHRLPDRVPIDIGGCVTTGIHAVALAKLRDFLGLEKKLIKVFEPMMFLGEVDEDVRIALGGDVVGLNAPSTLLGYRNTNWKSWKHPEGINVLIGDGFAVTYGPDGAVYAYPGGNITARPSAVMPQNGLYFDNLVRQEDLSDHIYDARKDYADQYGIFSDEDCEYYEITSKALYDNTDYAIFGNFFLGGVGDIFHIPGAWLENPKGIRNPQDWILAHYDHPEYIKEFFNLQMKVTLDNLLLYKQAVGNRIQVIAISGTDFGAQNSLMISPAHYREFYKPYHKVFNDWVHRNTEWKVFFHSCGSITELLEEFIEAGVDIINPVQISAAGMDPASLKRTFGDRIVFWGGGVDPQLTMPYGTPEDVEKETRKNVRIFSENGGYVCANVHNIQANTPVENILAFFRSVND